MRIKFLAMAISCAALMSSSANAAVIMDFAGLIPTGNEHPLDYYAGGFGSFGSGPGPGYGVTFSSGLYICAPPPVGTCTGTLGIPSGSALIPGNGPSIMNVSGGFTTGLSFYYSSQHGAAVDIYSGLDGTGTLLASLFLPGNESFEPPCPIGPSYCPFTPAGIGFAGTAYSVNLVPVTGDVAFADINLGSIEPATGVPEPLTITLFSMGLIGAAAARRRKMKMV
jgi:hypothetical protein